MCVQFSVPQISAPFIAESATSAAASVVKSTKPELLVAMRTHATSPYDLKMALRYSSLIELGRPLMRSSFVREDSVA
jgi:hypothetical protein